MYTTSDEAATSIVDALLSTYSETVLRRVSRLLSMHYARLEMEREDEDTTIEAEETTLEEEPEQSVEEVVEEPINENEDADGFEKLEIKEQATLIGTPLNAEKKPRKKREDPGIIDGKRPPERIGCFFLDSGAHSIYNKAHKTQTRENKYVYYETDEFWEYVDEYANFVKENKEGIDFYVNVDVIHNPVLSRRVQNYLEMEHDLNPVPVIHMGTPVSELKWYVDRGYDFIGLGGVALEGTRTSYLQWADEMFNFVCDNPKRLPMVKLHGFAMTAYASLIRYPWWSVDSASWAKAGGFGIIYVPHKRKGKFVFDVEPYSISVSSDAPAAKQAGRSVLNLSKQARTVILEWLESINVPFGAVDADNNEVEWGVVSHHSARKIANLRYYQSLCNSLPEWPWSFKATVSPSFGLV